ncbi:unnamed protein product [Arctia plantaginis]|uniref:Uncharacterized protein n=1 Tax=Arctia plantaginis TaxID=874455 RepID=A0A8S0ZD81_ARCPL|nr:unnamed protein product [Arctia plantaginis]
MSTIEWWELVSTGRASPPAPWLVLPEKSLRPAPRTPRPFPTLALSHSYTAQEHVWPNDRVSSMRNILSQGILEDL